MLSARTSRSTSRSSRSLPTGWMRRAAALAVLALAAPTAVLTATPATAGVADTQWRYADDIAPIVEHLARTDTVLHVETERVPGEVWLAFVRDHSKVNATPKIRNMFWVSTKREYRCPAATLRFEPNPYLSDQRLSCMREEEMIEAERPGYKAASDACVAQNNNQPWWRAMVYYPDSGNWGGCTDVLASRSGTLPEIRVAQERACAPWEPQGIASNGEEECLYTFYSWGGETPRHPKKKNPGYFDITNPAPGETQNSDGTWTSVRAATTTASATATATRTATRTVRIRHSIVRRTVRTNINGTTYTGAGKAPLRVTRTATVTRTVTVRRTGTGTGTGQCIRATQQEAYDCALALATSRAQTTAAAQAQQTATADAPAAAMAAARRDALATARQRALNATPTRKNRTRTVRLARKRAVANLNSKIPG